MRKARAAVLAWAVLLTACSSSLATRAGTDTEITLQVGEEYVYDLGTVNAAVGDVWAVLPPDPTNVAKAGVYSEYPDSAAPGTSGQGFVVVEAKAIGTATIKVFHCYRDNLSVDETCNKAPGSQTAPDKPDVTLRVSVTH